MKMQNDIQKDNIDLTTSEKIQEDKRSKSCKTSPSHGFMDEGEINDIKVSNIVPEISLSEEEVSEVESFEIEQEDDLLDTKLLLAQEVIEGVDVRTVDPETQERLEALLEAAGIGKLSTTDGKAYADPEVLRKLTSSVSCALDEAAAALTRMRAEQPGEAAAATAATAAAQSDKSLAKACSNGDVGRVRQLLTEGRSVHETTEEGESLLSLACSAGYYEVAQELLATSANVEDRGIKGDCTPLMQAASGGFTEIVRLLIEHDADVNAQSAAGNTPLHYAACGGHADIVSVLISAKANVEEHNENGHTPLMEAASAGHVNVAKILLDAGAGINIHSSEFKESALTLACYKGHLEMVKFLLDAGADHEHKTDEMHTALMEACMDGHVEVAKLLLDSGAQVNMPADSFESPLTLAACGGHVDLASLLIERDANLEEVNDEGYTPLMEAAREGHDEMVTLLLAHGADINAQTEETQETALTLACCGGFLEVADFLINAGAKIELGCSTPLMEAAQEGHLDLVKHLINKGANVNAQTQTLDTALTYACENGHTEVAEVLLDHGAELEHESEGGRTPLMKAARAGHPHTVQFLISKGADVNRQTSTNDHTVLSLACAGGYLQVVEILLKHGADPAHKLKDGSTMLIEASKGGHTQVVNLLLEWPNSAVSPTPEVASPLQANLENAEDMRVPRQGLINVVPPQDPNQVAIPYHNYLPNVQQNIPTPGDLNLSNFNIPTRSMDQIRENMAKSLNRKKAKISNANSEETCSNTFPNAGGQALVELDESFLEKGVAEGEMVPLELEDRPDMKASERLEAFINKMMRKAEMINNTREEQIQKKEQILQELQKVELELQEKAKQQLFAQHKFQQEQQQKQLTEGDGARGGGAMSAEGSQEQLSPASTAEDLTDGNNHPLSQAPTPVPLHEALRKDLVGQVKQANNNNAELDSSEITKMSNEQHLECGAEEYPPPEETPLPNDEDIEDYEEEDKRPQLAKQESLSSVASDSVDSGCDNNDDNSEEHKLEEEIMKLSSIILQELAQQEERVPCDGSSVDPEPIPPEFPLHNRDLDPIDGDSDSCDEANLEQAIEQSISQAIKAQQQLKAQQQQQQAGGDGSQGCSRESSPEEVDLSQVVPMAELPSHHMTPQQLQILQQQLQQQQLIQASIQENTISNSIITTAKQTQQALQMMIPLQIEAIPPQAITPSNAATIQQQLEQQRQQLQAQLALQQQLQHELQQQLKLQQEHEQLKQQLKAHQAQVALQQKQLQLNKNIQLKLQQTTTTLQIQQQQEQQGNGAADAGQGQQLQALPLPPATTITATTTTGHATQQDLQHQLKLQQVQQHLQQLHQQLQQVQKLQSSQQHTQQELLQQAQQLQQQLQAAQFQQLQQPHLHGQVPTSIGMQATAQHELVQQLQLAHLQQLQAQAAQQQAAAQQQQAAVQQQHAAAQQQQQAIVQQQVAAQQQEGVESPSTQKKKKKQLLPTQQQALPYIPQQPLQPHHQQILQLQQFQQQQQILQQQTQNQTIQNQQLTQLAQQVANYNNPAALANANNGQLWDYYLDIMPPSPSTPMTPTPSPASPQVSPPVYPSIELDAQTESNHDTALTVACAGGHEKLVRLLLSRGADIEHRDKKGFTPLILAATAGHADVVEILLEHAADIEAQSERTKDTPLSLACSGGRYEVVELLLARGANKEHRNVSDYTPLSLAASGGYVNIIKLLLSHGAEINSRTGSKLGISPLMLAAMNGHTAAVKLLLDMGSDINAQIETNRNTALTLACFQGRHEVVSLLVDRKANIEHRAKTGLTPLMEAASGGYVEVGRVLLDKGADVNAPPVPSSRDTALTIAADKGHYRFVELLISRGAAIDVKNKKGNSPLWLACNGGHLDVVQLLVEAKADVDSQDNRRVSCLMAAFRKGHVKVVKWLVKHVFQFPSDQECVRFIAYNSDKELLKKCHQCMEIIVSAKDRQAAEANKNASILLEEIEAERTEEERKKAKTARKREKKRQKKKEKQEKEKLETTDGEEVSKSSTPELEEEIEKVKENEDNKEKENLKIESKNNNKTLSSKSVKKSKSSAIEVEEIPLPPASAIANNADQVSSSSPSVNSTTEVKNRRNAQNSQQQQASTNSRDSSTTGTTRSRRKGKNKNRTDAVNATTKESKDEKNLEKEKNDVESIALKSAALPMTVGSTSGVVKAENKKNKITVAATTTYSSTTGIGELDDFGVPSPRSKSSTKTPTKDVDKKEKNQKISNADSYLLSPLKPGLKHHNTPSPKKGHPRKEDDWKEVIRKSKKVPVPANAVSRVIGRAGCNINAIREVSGANIELDKAKGTNDRMLTIKGSAEATKKAVDLVTAMIKEPDKEIEQLIPKLKKVVITTNTNTLSAGVWHNSMANNIGNSTPPTTVPGKHSAINGSAKNASGSTLPAMAKISHFIPSSVTTNTTTSNQRQNTMQNIGVFQAPTVTVGAWGNVPGVKNVGPPSNTAVGHVAKNSPSVVSRQLFPTGGADSPLSSHQADGSTTQTTVTYSSSTIAKTRVVATTVTTMSSAKLEQQVKPTPVGMAPNRLQTRAQNPSPVGRIPSSPAAPSKSEPQPLPIKSTQVAPSAISMSGMNVPPQRPIAAVNNKPAEYSPFYNQFSYVAEQMLGGKKEEETNKMNFASVAAAGVVPVSSNAAPASSAPVAPPASQESDPSLKAKAPGYKGPGQRTSSPHTSSSDPNLIKAMAFQSAQFNHMPPSALGGMGMVMPQDLPGYRPAMQPPIGQPGLAYGDHDFVKAPGYRQQQPIGHKPTEPGMPSPRDLYGMPQGGQLSPRSRNSTPIGGQSPRNIDPMREIREEYSMPNTPMTLPKIESTLNPNAPDFLSRGGRFNAGPLGANTPPPYPNMPIHPAFRGADAALAPHFAGNFGLGPLSASFSGSGAFGDPVTNPMLSESLPRQFSPLPGTARSASSTSSVCSKDGGSPGPQVSEASPVSSTIPSPTEQMRLPRPIGTERVYKKAPGSGFHTNSPDVGTNYWGYNSDGGVGAAGPDWLTAAITTTVVTTTVQVTTSLHTVSSGGERPQSNPTPMVGGGGVSSLPHSVGPMMMESSFLEQVSKNIQSQSGGAHMMHSQQPPIFSTNGLPNDTSVPNIQSVFGQAGMSAADGQSALQAFWNNAAHLKSEQNKPLLDPGVSWNWSNPPSNM